MPLIAIVTIPLFCCLRCCLRRGAVIQKDLYAVSLGPTFDLAESYASTMTIIFTALTFASGLPVILILAAFAL